MQLTVERCQNARRFASKNGAGGKSGRENENRKLGFKSANRTNSRANLEIEMCPGTSARLGGPFRFLFGMELVLPLSGHPQCYSWEGVIPCSSCGRCH